MLRRYARRVAAFVTFEDHVKMGGFGSAVIEALEEMGSAVPVVRIGWPDQFIEHGKVDDLRAKYGLTVEEAQAQVLPLLRTGATADAGGQLRASCANRCNRAFPDARSDPGSREPSDRLPIAVRQSTKTTFVCDLLRSSVV